MTIKTLADLCRDYREAKKREEEAAADRLKIEAEIIASMGAKPEGSQSERAGIYKVTTTGKVKRSMDWARWEIVKHQIPAQFHPIKTKLELDEKGVKYLQTAEPEIYKKLPITVEPAKTAVTVAIVDEVAA